ncbi:hypothetical protein [Stigmatella aurantiaca]|uniref:Conserved uncharacterized protein n=1 Tax=Stigmatella aurantiaca (strain DW4/3-1) TaxID=378806 RepID=E3FZR1_STIAD|nr:hypothetical protein [Stigmatella aurantiaca]ADO69926.1 conserved uncharacterized protein [Stigmatella aurantiaca DW4/3-1]
MGRPRLFTRALPVACMVLVALNDHWLKGSGGVPGWLTGKLSDVAGLYFAPLLLAELWLLVWPASCASAAARRVAWMALAVGGGFTAIKTLPEADALYETWLFALLRRPVRNTVDPTDLVALVMLVLSVGTAQRLCRQRAGEGGV